MARRVETIADICPRDPPKGVDNLAWLGMRFKNASMAAQLVQISMSMDIYSLGEAVDITSDMQGEVIYENKDGELAPWGLQIEGDPRKIMRQAFATALVVYAVAFNEEVEIPTPKRGIMTFKRETGIEKMNEVLEMTRPYFDLAIYAADQFGEVLADVEKMIKFLAEISKSGKMKS